MECSKRIYDTLGEYNFPKYIEVGILADIQNHISHDNRHQEE